MIVPLEYALLLIAISGCQSVESPRDNLPVLYRPVETYVLYSPVKGYRSRLQDGTPDGWIESDSYIELGDMQ